MSLVYTCLICIIIIAGCNPQRSRTTKPRPTISPSPNPTPSPETRVEQRAAELAPEQKIAPTTENGTEPKSSQSVTPVPTPGKAPNPMQGPETEVANTSVDQNKSEFVPWRAGGKPCQEPHYEDRVIAKNTFTIRQSKCLEYEAPFIHIVSGDKEAFVMDTGSVGLPTSLELRELVFKLVDEKSQVPKKILVGHSHSHSDHVAGDQAFAQSVRVELIGLDLQSIKKFFKIVSWPTQVVQYDLGGRVLDIIPIPGHDETSIAVYDRITKILFTGDSFYPGRLYITDHESYKASIQRLIDFSKKNEVKLILGTHIEMSTTPKKDYPIGSQYHPQEAPLELLLSDLELLNETLKKSGPRDFIRLDKFIIYPNFQ